MDDLAADFVCEATAALGGLQAGLARLARDRADVAAAADMAARLHGLKGVCAFVGFVRAEALAHAGEALLSAIQNTDASPAALVPLGAMIERFGLLFEAAAQLGVEPEGDDAPAIADLEQAAAALSPSQSIQPHGGEAASAPLVVVLPAVGGDRRRPPWLGLDSLARALGDRLGKRIDLAVGGDDVRLAPWAMAPLRTALIALVRNACDHGVETPAERRALAKPALSVLRLSLHRRGAGATIELADDGRGVDPERVRALCLAAGRLDAATAQALSPEQVQALIFDPGVTTAEAVTALSGRGLGLELVRREIQGLGGAVEFASAPGRGALFVLRLPASALATPAARGRAAA